MQLLRRYNNRDNAIIVIHQVYKIYCDAVYTILHCNTVHHNSVYKNAIYQIITRRIHFWYKSHISFKICLLEYIFLCEFRNDSDFPVTKKFIPLQRVGLDL